MAKTIKVDYIKDQVNKMLAGSTCSPDGRQGMIQVLEALLHESGNYNGFRYMLPDEVPAGHLPGINGILITEKPREEMLKAQFDNTDPTRVQYL